MAEWLSSSRFAGVARYQYKNTGRLVLRVLLIVLAVQILSLFMPFIVGNPYPFEGIGGSFEIVFFTAFITGIITAGRASSFLIRFGTPRTSVWLGSVLGQLVSMSGLLIGTLLINMLVAALLFPLSNLLPQGYAMDAVLYQRELWAGIENLPTLFLYTLEWASIFYLYGCMLRRFRALTISVSVGVPMMFVILMLIPAVREGLQVLRGNSNTEILRLGLQWVRILQDILRFIEEHWETLQLTAGIVSVPLSYLVMRGTKQP